MYAFTWKLTDIPFFCCVSRFGEINDLLALMNGHTIGAMVENYDVAMLAGHNVMHYNDSLKGDNVHESFEPHSKVFQDSHFDFSSII